MNLRRLLGLKPRLPAWARWGTDRGRPCVVVDTLAAYPRALAALREPLARYDGPELTQFKLEVVRRAVTMFLRRALQAAGAEQPKIILKADAARTYRLSRYPPGLGADLGSDLGPQFYALLPAGALH